MISGSRFLSDGGKIELKSLWFSTEVFISYVFIIQFLIDKISFNQSLIK